MSDAVQEALRAIESASIGLFEVAEGSGITALSESARALAAARGALGSDARRDAAFTRDLVTTAHAQRGRSTVGRDDGEHVVLSGPWHHTPEASRIAVVVTVPLTLFREVRVETVWEFFESAGQRRQAAVAPESSSQWFADRGLSPRETRVMTLLMEGFRVADIAASLGIAGSTVRGYLKTIFRKVGVSNQSELTLVAHAEKEAGRHAQPMTDLVIDPPPADARRRAGKLLDRAPLGVMHFKEERPEFASAGLREVLGVAKWEFEQGTQFVRLDPLRLCPGDAPLFLPRSASPAGRPVALLPLSEAEDSNRSTCLALPLEGLEDAFSMRARDREEDLAPDPEGAEGAQGVPGSASSLTRRQLAVVERLARGLRVHGIAREMGVSESTVRNHLQAVFRRLGVHSQGELVRLLREEGFPTEA